MLNLSKNEWDDKIVYVAFCKTIPEVSTGEIINPALNKPQLAFSVVVSLIDIGWPCEGKAHMTSFVGMMH